MQPRITTDMRRCRYIVDWRKRQVEIYLFDGKSDGSLYSYLYKTVTESNKDELQIIMFPNITITFDELFDFGMQ